jgi:hypothetical protein
MYTCVTAIQKSTFASRRPVRMVELVRQPSMHTVVSVSMATPETTVNWVITVGCAASVVQ